MMPRRSFEFTELSRVGDLSTADHLVHLKSIVTIS
jgi:hypothetical protein